jgi:hypothetical protein
MSKNQTIKLLKQLIGITTNKKDKAELNMLLKRTEVEGRKVEKVKKFNIRTFPATQAKAIGFKTKKALIEFAKLIK